MTKTSILLVGFLFSATSVLALGCSDDPEPTTSSSSSSSSGDVSSSSSGGGGSGGGSGGSGGGGGAMTPAEAYCNAIMTNCTAATQKQYPSMDSCMAAAPAFPAGMPADTMGDTLACRTYHSTAAGTDPATHCVHAGPAGGGMNFCGNTCEGFCDIAVSICPGQWADKTVCMAGCTPIPSNGMSYNTSYTSGNTIECRLYHLSVAAQSTADAMTHCPHTAAVSSTCN